MKPIIKLMLISTFAAVSSAQAAPQLSGLDDRVIVAETYSSQGAFAVINGNIQSGTYTSLGAETQILAGTGTLANPIPLYGPWGLGIYAGTIRGDIHSGTYTSTGDGAVVHGNITSGVDALNTADGYTSIGANGGVGGNILSDTYTTTGANSTVLGNITAGGVLTLGSGTSQPVTSINTDGVGPTAPDLTSRAVIIGNHQAAFKAMGGSTLLTPTYGADVTFAAGVHNVVDILSFAANTTITLDGLDNLDKDFIFNVGNYMVLGANVNVNLINAGADSRVIWNVLGDSTGGAGLGYASLGAGVNFIGEVLANSYISVGAGEALVSGVDNSCGGLYSKTGYVSVGATSVVGGIGCGATKTGLPPVVVPTPATALLFGLGLGLVGLVGVARRKKA